MIPAYDKSYLLKAQKSLGRMLDFACNELGFSACVFWRYFLASGVAERFGCGESRLLAGMSGIELAYEVLDRAGVEYIRVENPICADEKSPEYWAGWAIAYYQWISGLAFAEIESFKPIDGVIEMYHPFHEMDVSQFVETMARLQEMQLQNPVISAKIGTQISALNDRMAKSS